MKVFKTQITARSYELDGFAHVNHAVFLNYFEQARFEALEQGGFSLSELTKHGWAIHVVRVTVNYRKEVRLNEVLSIETRIASVGRTSLTIQQKAYLAPEMLAADAEVVAVWIGPDQKPMRVPEIAVSALTA